MKKTSKRLLAMMLSLIMVLSMANVLIFSASAVNPTSKLQNVLDSISNQCTVTIKPLNGATIPIQGYNIPGKVNLYIKDSNVAAVATVFGFLKAKLLLTDTSVYAILPLLRLFTQETVAELLTQIDCKDTDSIDEIIGSDNVSGLTIGTFRANPIAGIKTLFAVNMAAPIVTTGVTLPGVTGKTFTSEAYYDKLTPASNILFTCYFDGDILSYVTLNADETTTQDLLTFQVAITNTVRNTNVFKVPSLSNFYFDVKSITPIKSITILFK